MKFKMTIPIEHIETSRLPLDISSVHRYCYEVGTKVFFQNLKRDW